MTYKELIRRIARETRLDSKVVSKVLYALPTALSQTHPGEQTRTPLGVFHTKLKLGQTVKMPQGGTAEVPQRVVVALRSGKALKRES